MVSLGIEANLKDVVVVVDCFSSDQNHSGLFLLLINDLEYLGRVFASHDLG